MKSLVQSLAVLALLFVIVAFAVGWMTFHQSGPIATLEINTGKISESAQEALKMAQQFLAETGGEDPEAQVEFNTRE